MQNLKVLQKAYDMTNYGYVALRQFPKSEKYGLAAEIKFAMLQLMKHIIACNRRYYKKTSIQEIDVALDTLRMYIRLAKDLQFLDLKRYENWAKMLNELGRMVGGWMKSIQQ